MKLTAFLINDLKVYDELKSWSSDEIGSNTPLLIEAAVSDGYGEITDIEKIDMFGLLSGRDYLCVRDVLKTRIEEVAQTDYTDWNNLSATEKLIACKYFIPPRDKRLLVLNVSQQLALSSIHKTNCFTARTMRMNTLCGELDIRLSESDFQDVCDIITLDQTSRGSLEHMYLYKDRRGSLEENSSEGICDYILGRAGTTWDGVGLYQQIYSVEGMSDCTELAARLIDILNNGNY